MFIKTTHDKLSVKFNSRVTRTYLRDHLNIFTWKTFRPVAIHYEEFLTDTCSNFCVAGGMLEACLCCFSAWGP
jgi:hypothetical protein